MRTVLLIDVSYLAHRALHTTGGLSFQGSPTGVLFGVLRDIDILIDTHQATHCIFAFDSGGSGLRGQLDPRYKANRREKQLTDEERQIYLEFKQQLRRLKDRILPDLGYRNIHEAKGYEADDILAYYADQIESSDIGVIATADNDLWQCLRTPVVWYSPARKQTVTIASFYGEWDIDPVQWVDVKAIAGCSSDNVVGIKGIGEKTAVQWVRGKLKPSHIKYQLILDQLHTITGNYQLVRLPFPGLKLPQLVDDQLVTQRQKIEVLADLGIRDRRTTKSHKPQTQGFF